MFGAESAPIVWLYRWRRVFEINVINIVVMPRGAKIGMHGHNTPKDTDQGGMDEHQHDAKDFIPTSEFCLQLWNHMKTS